VNQVAVLPKKKFKDGLGYITRPCLKKPKRKQIKDLAMDHDFKVMTITDSIWRNFNMIRKCVTSSGDKAPYDYGCHFHSQQKERLVWIKISENKRDFDSSHFLDTLNCIHDLQNVKNFYSKS
jgi:hypothetical protein